MTECAWGVSGGSIRDTLAPSLGVRQPFPTADGPDYRHPTPPLKPLFYQRMHSRGGAQWQPDITAYGESGWERSLLATCGSVIRRERIPERTGRLERVP